MALVGIQINRKHVVHQTIFKSSVLWWKHGVLIALYFGATFFVLHQNGANGARKSRNPVVNQLLSAHLSVARNMLLSPHRAGIAQNFSLKHVEY
jgi:hypothetical protein